jgi:MFS family permease
VIERVRRFGADHLFANLILIRFLSLTGDSLIRFAIPVYVFTVTGSAAYSGVAYALEWGPRILVMPFIGALADRLPLRRQLLWLEGIRIGLLVVLAASAPVPLVIVIGSVFAVMNGYSYVLLEGCMSIMFGTARGGKLQARIQATDSLAMIAGPALGGILLTTHGFFAAVLVGSVCLIASVCFIVIFRVPLRPGTAVRRRLLSLDDLREVWHLIAGSPVMSRLLLLMALINLTEGTILALIPPAMLSTFGQTPFSVGVLTVAAEGAAALALIFLSFLLKHSRLSVLAAFAGAGMIVFALALGTAGNLAVFSAAFILFMVAQGIFVVHVRTERIRLIPLEHVGKIVSVMNSFILIPLPLSGLLIAALSGRFAPQAIILMALAASVLFIVPVFVVTDPRRRALQS